MVNSKHRKQNCGLKKMVLGCGGVEMVHVCVVCVVVCGVSAQLKFENRSFREI